MQPARNGFSLLSLDLTSAATMDFIRLAISAKRQKVQRCGVRAVSLSVSLKPFEMMRPCVLGVRRGSRWTNSARQMTAENEIIVARRAIKPIPLLKKTVKQ